MTTLRWTLVLFCALLFSGRMAFAQKLIYIDEFKGGVCADGFATDGKNFGNPATLKLDVPSSARIRKVLMLVGNHGSPSLTVTFDSRPINLSEATRFTGPFNSNYGTGYVHVVDITGQFDPKLTGHTLALPNQDFPMARFNEFYFIVCYESDLMESVAVRAYANDKDFGPAMKFRVAQDPFVQGTPYGLAIMGGYICNKVDGERIFVNGREIGILDTNDRNSGYCGGPVGSFRYENGELFGVGDDTPDATMRGNDALADISGYLVAGSPSFELDFQHLPSGSEYDNSIWGLVTVTGKGCRDRQYSRDTSICKGSWLELSSVDDPPAGNITWKELSTGNPIAGAAPRVQPLSRTRYLAEIIDPAGCITHDTITVVVTDESSRRDTTLCEGRTLDLAPTRDTLTNAYAWFELGSGKQLSGSKPRVTPVNGAAYVARITTAEGCRVEDTLRVTLTTSESYRRDTSICEGGSLRLRSEKDTVLYQHEWKDLLTSQDIAGAAPLVSPRTFGKYLAHIVAPNECDRYDTVYVDVVSAPQFSRDTTVCYSGNFQLVSFGDTSECRIEWHEAGVGALLIGEMPIVSATGNTRFVARIEDRQGCLSYDTIRVSVKLETGRWDTTICFGEMLSLTPLRDTGVYTYEWYDVQAGSVLGGEMPTVSVLGPAVYVARIQDPAGCLSFDTIKVTATVSEYTSRDTVLCSGSDLKLQSSRDTTLYRHEWMEYPTMTRVDGAAPIVTPAHRSRYVVRMIDRNGCADFDTLSISLASEITRKFDTAICAGNTLTLRPLFDTSLYSCTWSNAITGEQLQYAAPDVVPTDGDIYILKALGEGCPRYDTLTVTVSRIVQFNARFTTNESLWGDNGGGMSILVTCEPPVMISSPTRLSMQLKVNDDLISLAGAAVDPVSIAPTLSKQGDHYLLELDVPADHGVFDTALVTIIGSSFVTSVAVDTCYMFNVNPGVTGECLAVEHSASIVTRRLDECGDGTLRETAWPEQQSILIRKDGDLITIEALSPERSTAQVSISDILGRVLWRQEAIDLPARLPAAWAFAEPLMVEVIVGDRRFFRLLLP